MSADTARVPVPRRRDFHDAAALAELASVLAGLTDARKMERLLEELLTRAETRTLVLRWRLLKLLRAGVPQREIARHLGVSLCKITRGSRVLKQPGSVVGALLAGQPRPGDGRN